MIKIGDFSKLAHVTVKTLRHYAKVGLLKPARIDRFSGYRYYTLDQLPRLNRILALKNLGFSLDQIAVVINSDLSVEKLHAMLCRKQEELQKRLLIEQERLAQVERRIRQIELEGSLPQQDFLLKRVPSETILSVRRIIESIEILPEQVLKMHNFLREIVSVAGIRKDCPWMVIQHNPEYAEQKVDVEIGLVLDAESTTKCQQLPLADCQIRTLPAIETMASVLLQGDIDLTSTYTALYAWIQSGGYRSTGSSREIHLCPPDKPSTTPVMMEIQVPVERVTIQTTNLSGKEQEMEPKFITKPAFLVAGTLYQGKNQHNEIPQMWGNEFLPRLNEINRVDPEVTYGVCFMEEGLPEGEFCYMAAAEIKSENDLPAGMKVFKVPEQQYAVFEHRGLLDTLGKTFEYINQSWLPRSRYKRTDGPELEVYNCDFIPDSEDSILYLYIPVC